MIRRLRAGDEDLHVALARQFKEHAPTVEQSRLFLADERNWLLAAMQDGLPVGFALAYHVERWDGDWHVFFYEIGVAAACRSQGYGRGLVDELVRLARASGAKDMWVETEPENEPANRLYESCGAARDLPDRANWVWSFDQSASTRGASASATRSNQT